MDIENDILSFRWGIIATGVIASWFVEDILIPRPDTLANHRVAAIGSSSRTKDELFAQNHVPPDVLLPKCYGSYEEVYADPNVDIVYIATPHTLHRQNCLDAIQVGKHVLCEKAFTLNATEAKDVVDAPRSKGVLSQRYNNLLHTDKVIGNLQRAFCNFGLDMPLASLPITSRLKDPTLGAGSLLDIGIYSLTCGLLELGEGKGKPQAPVVTSAQTISDGIDISSSMLLFYPLTGRHGILTSRTLHKTDQTFCRIEGSLGIVLISGDVASMPDTITIIRKATDTGKDMGDKKVQIEDHDEERKEVFRLAEHSVTAKGFYYEADHVALRIF